MQAQNTTTGKFAIDPEKVICFPAGLPGFPALKDFILHPVDDKEIFTWMQSTAEPQVAFLLTDPFAFFADYAVELEPGICRDLGIESREDVVIQTIVTIPDTGVQDMTANLVGPIVINVKDRKGQQLILTNSGYTTRHRLFQKDIPIEKDCPQKAGEG